MQTFQGSQLRVAIDQVGASIMDVSRDTGISREQVHKYLRDEAVPSANNLQQLAARTKKPLSFFFGESASNTTRSEVANDPTPAA